MIPIPDTPRDRRTRSSLFCLLSMTDSTAHAILNFLGRSDIVAPCAVSRKLLRWSTHPCLLAWSYLTLYNVRNSTFELCDGKSILTKRGNCSQFALSRFSRIRALRVVDAGAAEQHVDWSRVQATIETLVIDLCYREIESTKRSWLRNLMSRLPRLSTLVIYDYSYGLGTPSKCFTNGATLHTICLWDMQVTDSMLATIADHCPLLKRLSIATRCCSKYSMRGVKAITTRCHLRSLELGGDHNFGEEEDSELTDTLLPGSVLAESLQELGVEHCRSLTDDFLQSLVKCTPLLQKLYVEGCKSMTTKGLIDAVSQLPLRVLCADYIHDSFDTGEKIINIARAMPLAEFVSLDSPQCLQGR